MGHNRMTIKEVRQSIGLTQENMAKLMGMTRPQLTAIETPRSPRSETRSALRATCLTNGIVLA